MCQGSLYFACKAMSEQYSGDGFRDGQKFYWQADTENSEYVLFVGSNLFDENYGPPNRSPRVTERGSVACSARPGTASSAFVRPFRSAPELPGRRARGRLFNPRRPAMTMTAKNESKALEEIGEVRRGLLELARALLRAATTTVLAATGAVVALVDVALVELTKRVRKPTPGGDPVPTVAEAEGGALHP